MQSQVTAMFTSVQTDLYPWFFNHYITEEILGRENPSQIFEIPVAAFGFIFNYVHDIFKDSKLTIHFFQVTLTDTSRHFL